MAAVSTTAPSTALKTGTAEASALADLVYARGSRRTLDLGALRPRLPLVDAHQPSSSSSAYLNHNRNHHPSHSSTYHARAHASTVVLAAAPAAAVAAVASADSAQLSAPAVAVVPSLAAECVDATSAAKCCNNTNSDSDSSNSDSSSNSADSTASSSDSNNTVCVSARAAEELSREQLVLAAQQVLGFSFPERSPPMSSRRGHDQQQQQHELECESVFSGYIFVDGKQLAWTRHLGTRRSRLALSLRDDSLEQSTVTVLPLL